MSQLHLHSNILTQRLHAKGKLKKHPYRGDVFYTYKKMKSTEQKLWIFCGHPSMDADPWPAD